MEMKYKSIKEIKGFENCKINYLIYEDGSIYSEKTKRFLKCSTDSKGYKCLDLTHSKCKYRCPKVHRLVALAFIQNPNSLPQINHKDGNKKNNKVDNLEWCANLYNTREAVRLGLKPRYEYHGKLYQYDLNNNLLNIFQTPIDAARSISTKATGSDINRCIHGKRKTAYGYIWKSEEQVQRLSQACEYIQANGNGENPYIEG